MSHVLVVGGTGMLREVVLHLAAEGNRVSVIARRTTGLRGLELEASRLSGSVNPISLDYRNSAKLREELAKGDSLYGPASLAICWIHSEAVEAPFVVAGVISRGPSCCRFFEILGSAASQLARLGRDRSSEFRHFPNLLYRQIILGFVIEPGGSRWLSHEEISEGVLNAVRSDRELSIVGIVEPWSARPS